MKARRHEGGGVKMAVQGWRNGGGAIPFDDSGRARHGPAGIRAAAARLRALLAVIHPVLPAFVAACLADVGALPAQRHGKCAAARHVRRGKPANLGTVDIQGNAARHHLDVVLGQAGGRAVVARGGAGVTGINAFLKV